MKWHIKEKAKQPQKTMRHHDLNLNRDSIGNPRVVDIFSQHAFGMDE